MKITITNKVIYDEIVALKLHVIETNGRVKLNRWIATTALSLAIILAGISATPTVLLGLALI